MLQTIREHTQGWIAGTIISIIILTFALWGIHSYFVGGGNNSVIAEVNGTDISKEQLTVAYERLRRQMIIQYGAGAQKDEAALKGRAIQALVDVEVLKQASAKQGFRISNMQVDNYLQSMPEFQVDGQFSVERLQEVLSSTMMTTGDFLDLIKTSLLVDQPKLGIAFTSFSLPEETKYVISLVNQERDMQYINIPLQHFLSQSINISADKIQAYYDEHKSDYMTPEQVNLEFLQLSIKDLTDRIAPTDTMLKNFYNENINSYTQPMEWKLADIEVSVSPNASQEDIAKAQAKADEIVQSLQKGIDFTSLAKQNAQSLSGQAFMSLSQVPAELQKAVSELTKPGQISNPIKTAKGFVILKLVDIQEPKIQPFEKVQDKVKETYVHQHAEEKFAELRDQLADLTYEHPESLQFAAKTLNLPIQTTETFTKAKGGKDISQFKKVRDVAFSNDVLNLQNNSDVIQLNPETVIVVRVKSHVASTLLPLSDISKQIEDKLKTAEADARAEKLANDLKAKLQSGADAQALAAQNGLSWSQTGFLGRYSTKVDTAVLDLAFRLPNPSVANTKMTFGVTRIPNGYAIVALKSVKEGTVADEKQYNVFAEQVQNSEGLLEYELYKLSQTKKSKIVINSQQ